MKTQKITNFGTSSIVGVFAVLVIFCLTFTTCSQPTNPTPKTYTVKFMDGSTELFAVNVEGGKTVSRPSNPSKTGYVFNNWYADSGLSVLFNFSTPITSNTTVYAKFNINTYTVTFWDDSSILSTLTRNNVAYGSTVSRPSNPLKSGYTFDNWYADSGLNTLFNFNTPITGNTAVHAKWTENLPSDIAVTFSSVSADGSATATTTKLTLIFDKNIDGLTAADIGLSAGSTGAQKTSLNVLGGGMYELGLSGIIAGGTLTVAVAKSGYTISGSPKMVTIYYVIPVTFNGVNANGSATQTTTQLTLTFSQVIAGLSANDITLSGVSGVQKGTLSNSGTTYTLSISGFTAGGTLTVAVAKSGYTISGSPKTVTIYYVNTVTFNSNGGTNVYPQYIISGGKVSEPYVTKEGHALAGWFKDDGSQWNFDEHSVWNDFTLYARWMVPVTDINDVPATMTAGTSLTLTGTVQPDDATNKTVAWSIKSAGNTGAMIDGNTLNATTVGTVTVTATIDNGEAMGIPYAKDFTITVQKAVSFTITFAGIVDAAPLIVNQTISLTGANKTVTLTVDDHELYSSIAWYVTGSYVSGSGVSFILDSANTAYNSPGEHFLTLEVWKDGKLYNKTIIFEVVE